jgi:hypothetical protein
MFPAINNETFSFISFTFKALFIFAKIYFQTFITLPVTKLSFKIIIFYMVIS